MGQQCDRTGINIGSVKFCLCYLIDDMKLEKAIWSQICLFPKVEIDSKSNAPGGFFFFFELPLEET